MFNKTLTACIVALLSSLHATAQETDIHERFKEMSGRAEAKGLAEPYRGIAIGGEIESQLFPIRSTGVSTEPVRSAANAFISTLTEERMERTLYSVDDSDVRRQGIPDIKWPDLRESFDSSGFCLRSFLSVV